MGKNRLLNNRVIAWGLAGVLMLMTLAVGLAVMPTRAEPQINNRGITMYLMEENQQAPGNFVKDSTAEDGIAFWAGKEAKFSLWISNTGPDQGFPFYDAKLTLNYAVTGIDISGADAENQFQLISPTIDLAWAPPVVDVTAFETTWELGVLDDDGRHIIDNSTREDYTFTVKMPNYVTPDGYELHITATLTYEDGEGKTLVQDPEEIVIKWRCEELKTIKYVANDRYNRGLTDDSPVDKGFGEYNAYDVWGGIDDKAGKIDAKSANPITYLIEFVAPDSDAYRAVDSENTVTIDRLPEGAHFDRALNPGWVDHEMDSSVELGTVRYTGIPVDTEGNLLPLPLILSFPGFEAGTYPFNGVERTVHIKDPQQMEIDAGKAAYSNQAGCYVHLWASSISPSILEDMLRKTAVAPKMGETRLEYTEATRINTRYHLNGDFWWINQVENKLDDVCDDVVIRDDNLHPDMRFTKLIVYAPHGQDMPDILIQYHVTGESEWRNLPDSADRPDISGGSMNPDALKNLDLQEAIKEYDPQDDFFYWFRPYEADSGHRASAVIELPNPPAGEYIDGVKVSVDALGKGNRLILAVCAVFRDNIPNELDFKPAESYPNTTTFSVGSDELEVTARHIIDQYNPTLVANHSSPGLLTGNTNYGTRMVGGSFLIHTRLYTLNMDSQDTVLSIAGNEVRYIVLLPVGLDYVPGTVTVNAGNDKYLERLLPADPLHPTEPLIQENFKNTGKIALIWKLKPGEYLSTEDLFNMYFEVYVSPYCDDGNNIIDLYYLWPETARISASRLATGARAFAHRDPDVLGLGSNGETVTQLLHDNPNFTLDSSGSVIAKESVKGNLNQTHQFPRYVKAIYEEDEDDNPVIANQEAIKEGLAPGLGTPGSDASFQLTLSNNGTGIMREIKIFDLLPHPGDKALVLPTGYSWTDKELLKDTDFDVRLTGPVTLDDSSSLGGSVFNIFYATKDPSNWTGIENYETGLTWLTESAITDWSTVRAFKLEMKTGVYLNSRAKIVVNVPVKLPVISLDDEQLYAFNSFAYRDNSPVGYLEATKVGIRMTDPVHDVKITKKVRDTVGSYDAEGNYVDHAKFMIDPADTLTVTYMITVTNKTSYQATDVTVTDTMPSGLSYLGCDWPDSSDVSPPSDGGPLTVKIGNLEGYGTRSFKVTVTANAPSGPDGIVNVAKVTIAEPEEDDTDNEDDARIDIVAEGAIHLRQLIIDSQGELVDADLPEAYVHILTNTVKDYWVTFASKLYSQTEYDSYRYYCDVAPLDLGTSFTVVPVIPGGYSLVVNGLVVDGVKVNGIEWAYTRNEKNPTVGNSFTINYENPEAWVTIILIKDKPQTADAKIVNRFPPFPVS